MRSLRDEVPPNEPLAQGISPQYQKRTGFLSRQYGGNAFGKSQRQPLFNWMPWIRKGEIVSLKWPG